jgi:hypothetical protein
VAITLERKVILTIGTTPIDTTLLFDDANKTVTVKVDARGSEYSGTWKFDVENKSLQFTPSMLVGAPQIACIIACLGTGVGKPLLECLMKSRTLDEIKKCLEEKAVGALADVAVCIAGCLAL